MLPAALLDFLHAIPEFSWNPTGTARDGGIAYRDAQSAILRAVEGAQRDFGIGARLRRDPEAGQPFSTGRFGSRHHSLQLPA